MPVTDGPCVGEMVDGCDLVDAGLIGRKGGLQVDLLYKKQEVFVFDFHDAEDERGVLDGVLAVELVGFGDVWIGRSELSNWMALVRLLMMIWVWKWASRGTI